MATTFNWSINQMVTIPTYSGYSYFVTTVSYVYNAINSSGYAANILGQLVFTEVMDTPEHPYIPYSALTETEVIIWLDTYTNVAALQSQLEIDLYEQMNPPVVILPLPWNVNPN